MASVASADMLSDPTFEVRPYTMGGASVNTILKSHSNIWEFPQTINQYPNQAEGVFSDFSGSNSFPRFGAHYQFNEGNNPFVVGVYFNNQSTYNPFGMINPNTGNYGYAGMDFSGPRPFSQGAGFLRNNRQLNAFYGRNLGGNPFGVHLYTFNSNDEDENPGGFRKGLTSVGASFGLTTGGGAWDWAVDFGTTTFTDERDVSGTVTPYTKSDGNYYFGFKGRRWFPVNSKITWVAHTMVHYSRIAIIDGGQTSTDAREKIDNLDFNAGLGLNFTPSSKVHAIFDVMFEYTTSGQERDITGDGTLNVDNTDKYFSVPPSYTAGVDAEVLSWLDLRMGASNYRTGFTSEDNLGSGAQRKYSQHDTQTFLGFGLHFGDLEVDTYVDPRFAVNGPYFVSGDNTNNMFMTAAATLHF